MSILIGADIVPTESNQELFAKGDVEHLLGTELLRIIHSADYRIANLEVPLVDNAEPIPKEGPNLIAPANCKKGLKAMGIDLLTLANNHILDQGVQGLSSTIDVLNTSGISFVGAGMNLREAEEPFFFSINGKRYGVYACAEHEFSIAGNNQPGANPFNPLESLDHVQQMKALCDFAIVLYHGGKEYYRYPSPYLQKVCRKFVEKGADLVICQHSHCIGCEENYLGGTIVYGQGNFIFDHGDNKFWNTSVLIQIEEDMQIKYVPVIKKRHTVRLAERNEAEVILSAFRKRSTEIKNEGFLNNKYNEFANKMLGDYIVFFLGIHKSFFYRAINKLSGQRLQALIVNRVMKRRGLGLRNYIECEAHRELLLEGMRRDANH